MGTLAHDYKLRIGPLVTWYQTGVQNFAPENQVFVGNEASTFQGGAMVAGSIRFVNKKSWFLRLGTTYCYAEQANFNGVRAAKPDCEVLVASKKVRASMLLFSTEVGLRMR